MKIAVWNIGHFNGGNEKKTAIPEEKLDAAKAAFRGYIDEVGADVFGVCEHSYMFCNSDTLYKLGPVDAQSAIFGDYPHYYEGAQQNYSANAIFSKVEFDVRKKLFACNESAVITHTDRIRASDYYYLKASIKIDGELVTLIVCHLAFDANLDPDTLNEAQITELIEVLKGEERVIIAGDFNCKRFESLDLFKNAGYTLAGDASLITYPAGQSNRALDNIIVKGLKVENVRVYPTALSDHYAVSADVTL